MEKLNETLKTEKATLLEKKKSIENQISDIDTKIRNNNSKITILNFKKNAITTLLKRNCSFYETPNENSKIIEFPKKKTNIYLIEYYAYGTYFKAIYNNKIGYIKEKDIRQIKNVRELKLAKKSDNTYSNSLLSKESTKKTNEKKRTYSRSYYRGSRGGCYYINSNGNKSYVSRSLCN
ncbi:hypothetical protein LPB03_06785 [Polaribacter vadi]|uniref:SH3b domain-containing protein n=1 Tax=Polaribacter vadi TaxID=1774273 RepID=A0A1B8TZ01_9FLAO|nr:hypothetical protein LPB03_06785 [Polaribacter vadi]OBY64887.1 hypothetical protein LPB3_05705 [Polaribacter vadi]